jgi:hypothetical protein
MWRGKWTDDLAAGRLDLVFFGDRRWRSATRDVLSSLPPAQFS